RLRRAAQRREGRRREGARRRADDPGRASGGGAGGRVRRVVDRVPRPGVDHGLRRDDRVRDRVRSHVYYAFRRAGIAFPYPVQMQESPRDPSVPAPSSETALDDVEILASLTDGQRHQLAAMSRLLLYGAGEMIAREGEPGASMFVMRR